MVTRTAILLTILSLCLQAPRAAQLRVRPVAEEGGTVELALLLRKLQAGPTFMMTTAHPDDENNALLAELDWGLGLRTTLVTATRGQGPYPARVGRGRVTDETSGVKVLEPSHPVFTTPNRIGPDTWEGWVQERGLYFLDPEGRAPEYTDLVELEDPFPYNRGVQRGALVEAQVGKGRWIYLGLGLWRQLPAGTPGAYKLMANLVALGAPPGGAGVR